MKIFRHFGIIYKKLFNFLKNVVISNKKL